MTWWLVGYEAAVGRWWQVSVTLNHRDMRHPDFKAMKRARVRDALKQLRRVVPSGLSQLQLSEEIEPAFK
jgi:hypothetical protein